MLLVRMLHISPCQCAQHSTIPKSLRQIATTVTQQRGQHQIRSRVTFAACHMQAQTSVGGYSSAALSRPDLRHQISLYPLITRSGSSTSDTTRTSSCRSRGFKISTAAAALGSAPATAHEQLSVANEGAASATLYEHGTHTEWSGAFAVRQATGKGLGLFATSALRTGDLVLLSAPLAILHGPPDEMPDPEDLVSHLQHMTLSAGQQAALLALCGGSDSSIGSKSSPVATEHNNATSSGNCVQDSAAPKVTAAKDFPNIMTSTGSSKDQNTSASGASRNDSDSQNGNSSGSTSSSSRLIVRSASNHFESSSSSSKVSDRAQSGGDSSRSWQAVVPSVVAHNAFGDAFEDLAAAKLREAPAQSHVGLWPAPFSRANHSCLPNCINYVIGSTMVVRACRPVASGAELTISYLGREEFMPATNRRQLLQDRYGFQCSCPRCTTELALPPAVSTTLQSVHERVKHEVMPLLVSAADAKLDDAELDDAGNNDSTVSNDGLDPVSSSASKGNGAVSGLQHHFAAALGGKSAHGDDARKQSERLLQQVGAVLEELGAQLHTAMDQLSSGTQPNAAATPAAGEHSALTQSPRPASAASDAPPSLPLGGNGGPAAVEDEFKAEDASAHDRADSVETQLLWLESSVYNFFEAMFMHAELSGAEGGADALAMAYDIIDAVSPGSELHVWQGCRMLKDAIAKGTGGSSGGGSSAAKEAAGLVGQACLARYGRVPGPLLRRLVAANTEVGAAYV